MVCFRLDFRLTDCEKQQGPVDRVGDFDSDFICGLRLIRQKSELTSFRDSL